MGFIKIYSKKYRIVICRKANANSTTNSGKLFELITR